MRVLAFLARLLPSRDDERGRVVLLIAGLFGILAMLIVGGVNVTAIQLARMQVLDAADAAAANAADSADVGALYGGGVGSELTLSDQSVQQVAERTLAREQVPAHVLGWHIGDGTGTDDGRTAVVKVTAVVHPPLLGGVMSSMFGDVHVTVQSHARAHVN